MPGYILTTASIITCTHGGMVSLTTSNSKVKVDGMPALLESDIHTVAGCVFTIPGPKPQPCVRVEWMAGATMCKGDGTAVLTQSSVGKCISADGITQGLAIVLQTQMKAKAT